eukprot:10074186-Alexandrium_andersonii.AAC.1
MVNKTAGTEILRHMGAWARRLLDMRNFGTWADGQKDCWKWKFCTGAHGRTDCWTCETSAHGHMVKKTAA